MKALLIIAVVLQSIGLGVKLLGLLGFILNLDSSDKPNGFGVYSVWSLLPTIFFEVAFILALCNL